MLRTMAFIGQLALSILAWLGIAGQHSAQAHIPPTVAAERSAIQDRMDRARERLAGSEAPTGASDSKSRPIAQWFNWPNWGNWFNGWRNW
jgi:hypothetical protein